MKTLLCLLSFSNFLFCQSKLLGTWKLNSSENNFIKIHNTQNGQFIDFIKLIRENRCISSYTLPLKDPLFGNSFFNEDISSKEILNGMKKKVSIILLDENVILIKKKNIAGTNRNFLNDIGALIEKPDFYKNLTALENLKILFKMSKTLEGQLSISTS